MAEFVEVIVEATGRRQTVPADWLDNPVLGAGISLAPTEATAPTPEPVAPPTGPPEVQTVLGESDDLPASPAAREAVLAAREAAAAAADAAPPTADDSHKVIDAFAESHGIDLGAAKTKAEKVEVITTHLTDGTPPADEDPDAGDKE